MPVDWESTEPDLHERFWDDVAARYDEEIFNTLKSDRNDSLGQTIRRYASQASSVCDFGCGVGRFLPLLAECTPNVVATDFSAASLDIAKRAVKDQPIRLLKRDLSKPVRRFCDVEVGLLINVLIMPSAEHRENILSNVSRNLSPHGVLIVATPSYESALYTYCRLLEWEVREGESHAAAAKSLDRSARKEIANIADGIINIEGTATKHHLRAELVWFLEKHKFNVEEELRIEYEWNEDFESPPKWLKQPYPWDWLFVARKR